MRRFPVRPTRAACRGPDVKILLGGSIPKSTLETLSAKVNSTSFLAVAVPGSNYKVLITPFGDLGDGTFLDPQGSQRLTIDHGKQVCTGSDALTSSQCNDKSGAHPGRPLPQRARPASVPPPRVALGESEGAAAALRRAAASPAHTRPVPA